MTWLLKGVYLVACFLIGTYGYFYLSILKRIGIATREEINEEAVEGEEVTEKEVRQVRDIGSILFIILGFVLWAFLGWTAGVVLSKFTSIRWVNILIIVFGYFLFLRLPFGTANRMIKKAHNLKRFSEKTQFALVMILFFLLSVFAFDYFPDFLKWHFKPLGIH